MNTELVLLHDGNDTGFWVWKDHLHDESDFADAAREHEGRLATVVKAAQEWYAVTEHLVIRTDTNQDQRDQVIIALNGFGVALYALDKATNAPS